MAIADPQILLVMDESSGTAVANLGTLADVSIVQGVENTDWSWNPDADSALSYFESLNGAGTSQAIIDCSALTFAPALADESVAARFTVNAFDTRAAGQGFILGASEGHPFNGFATITIDNPTSTGDFNLHCRFSTNGAFDDEYIFEDLSFGVEYSLAMSCDVTTAPPASTGRFKLDAGAVQTDTTVNKGSNLDAAGPYIGRASGFNQYYGWEGRLKYLAYWRGYALLVTELGDVNSDPTNIPLFPGGANPSQMSGSSSLDFAASAALRARGRMQGSSALNFAASGTIRAGSAPACSITDVNGDVAWTDGDTGLIITGTGFLT